MPNVDINGTVVEFPDLDPKSLQDAVSKAAGQMGQSQQPEDKGFLGNAAQDISGLLETGRRAGQGLINLPGDIYQTGKQALNGQSLSGTPIGQDVKTLGNVALESLPHGVTDPKASNLPLLGQYRIEPGSILRQYQDLAAQPLKMIPGKIGQTMKQEYPENPLTQHPVNSVLALAPLAKPLFSSMREIPGVDEGLNKASDYVRQNMVAPNARRALGKFPMKMPIEQANQVGLDAMDRGVIKNPLTNPLSSSKESMLSRASAINDSLGEEIGSFLKGQNESLDTTRAMQELDQLRNHPDIMNDPHIVSKIDKAKEMVSINSSNPVQDVMALNKKPQTMEFSPANKLKGIFQNKVDYNSPKASQLGDKAIASSFRNSIDTQLDELAKKLGNQGGMDSFLSAKKGFGSTAKMQDALTGQVTRDSRNMPVSLPSLGVGLAGFLHGGAVKGILDTLAAQWVKQYGSATAATMANDVSKLLENVGKSSEVKVPSLLKAIAPAISEANKKAPHGKVVQQDGRTYKWNGSEYVEQ